MTERALTSIAALDALVAPDGLARTALKLAEPLTDRGHGELVDPVSAATWPVLGHVPILTPDPFAWCARFRDAALGSLATRGLADPDAVRLLDGYAERRDELQPEPFPRDWTASEARAATRQSVDRVDPVGGRPVADAFRRFVADASGHTPQSRLAAWVRQAPRRRVLEVGPGAGGLTAALSEQGGELVVLDQSLESLRLAGRASAGRATLVVGDAEELPFAWESFDAVVAAHVVDLLDDPAEFVAAASARVAPGGLLALATPDPGLAGAGPLVDRFHENGLEVLAVEDGLPWLRQHTRRHIQVYLSQVVVGVQPG